ncbi:MAG: hypothetical protein GY824_07805, partial [Delftia sp.]|nr:hypothetical protein [Delftia sp.]
MAGELSRLCEFIADGYDLDEFQTLCFKLGVRYEDLGGKGLSGKARELVLYAGRQERLEQLLKTISRERPAGFDLGLDDATVKALYGQLPAFEADAAPATTTTIRQQAGDDAIQIGQVQGDVTIYKGVSPPQPADDAPDPAALLAALPIADVDPTIPDPAPLPPGSRMPLARNPLFVGREKDLRALAVALKGGETIAIGQVNIAAATGLGGIGKSQLANEFVHRYGQFFAGGVFWLGFGDAGNVPAEIAACGGPDMLDLHPDFSKLPLPDQVRLVRAAWREPLPRLLVFDNCEDEALLTEWRPTTGGCRVLVTSRRGKWSRGIGVQALALDVLERDESIALLRGHRPNLDQAQADAIADELGDLPLALHLAGSFLESYQHAITPKAYLAQLRDAALLGHPSLQGRGAGL